jgi:hypothetical protein
VVRITVLLLSGIVTSIAVASEGVSVDVAALDDGVAFCINTSADQKISAEYGIEFWPDTASGWREKFPKLVTADRAYFELPLRIHLKRRGEVAGTRMHVKLGTCSVSKGQCELVEITVRIPDGSTGPRCIR